MTEFFSLLLSPFPLPLSSLLLLPVILVGHAFLWVAAINRIHATGWPRRIIGCWTIAMFLMLGLLPPAAIWWLIASAGADVAAAAEPRPLSMPCAAVVYALACCAGAVLAVSHWLRFHVFRRPPELLRSEREIAVDRGADCQSADSESRLGNLPHDASHFLTRLPCNEVLRLRVVEREIEVARLPAALDGLRIVHLSDPHLTGRVGRRYFEEAARISNELAPDLVAVTGDLADASRWIDWIPDTLGRLRGRHGVYFILGNHEIRVDIPRLIDVFEHSGGVYLGGRSHAIDLGGTPVVLAGNESPWFPAAPLGDCRPWQTAALRIVLAHSPDQIHWARPLGADLVLAGHTHGGQICLPGIGPIFSPCRDGVRYASGVFDLPPTILHVTQGLSAELPLRFGCPPEVTLLVLRACPLHEA